MLAAAHIKATILAEAYGTNLNRSTNENL